MHVLILLAIGGLALWAYSRSAGAAPLETFNGNVTDSFFSSMPGLDALSQPDAALNLEPLIDMGTARGIRNNNPGNVRYNPAVHWQGQVGSDGAFVIFDTPDNGLRALGKILRNYQSKYGLSTVRGIITRYAPPSENNTAAYATAVAGELGVTPDTRIDTGDPATLAALMGAIVRHENGSTPYGSGLIAASAAAAIAA